MHAHLETPHAPPSRSELYRRKTLFFGRFSNLKKNPNGTWTHPPTSNFFFGNKINFAKHSGHSNSYFRKTFSPPLLRILSSTDSPLRVLARTSNKPLLWRIPYRNTHSFAQFNIFPLRPEGQLLFVYSNPHDVGLLLQMLKLRFANSSNTTPYVTIIASSSNVTFHGNILCSSSCSD